MTDVVVHEGQENEPDVKALTEAFALFTNSTQKLEEAYQLLQARATELGQELAAKNHELALTNDYLNYILEGMSDGVITIDTCGLITKFNLAASQVLGYDAAEVVGSSFRALFERDFSLSMTAASTRLRARSGRHVSVIERDAPIADREGCHIGTVKVFQDLTEIEALREQVRQRERLAAIGEMAATVAHEIRNPLGGIRGFASLLARDLPETDPRSRLVEKILAGVKLLDRVVGELLEYTRPVELRLRPVSCHELTDAVLTFLDVGGKSIVVTQSIAPEFKVLADPDKMRQVLLNILLNAAQSIEQEGMIGVVAEADADYVTLTVTDSGNGIREEDLERVFSPFFTTKERGTGLGLAVAAKIVEGHAGTLKAESKLGVGSAFHIRLPRTE